MSENENSQVSGVRYANIGVAVGMLVTIGVALLIGPGNEDTVGLAAVPGFIAAGVVYYNLWERAKRRAREDQ